MPYTKKQIGYFHANPGTLSKSQLAEADASVKGGNYLPAHNNPEAKKGMKSAHRIATGEHDGRTY
jgi:hypothetical protein